MVPDSKPAYLDTLAAAYAEVGRFEEAVGTQRKAITLATEAGKRGLLRDYRQRLSLYGAQRPYRQLGG